MISRFWFKKMISIMEREDHILRFCYSPGVQKEKAAEEEPEVDPDVAAMMGFGGFRSSKK